MVNVKDVKKITGEADYAHQYLLRGDGCRLRAIFARQSDLETQYHPLEEKNVGHPLPHPFGVLATDIDDPARQRRIKEIGMRMIEELTEATNTLKNGKPWKSSHVKTDTDHFVEEIADSLHFFVELCLCAGITVEMLFQTYMDKSRVNQFRQDTNY